MKNYVITYWTIATNLRVMHFNSYTNAKEYYLKHKTNKPIKHTVSYAKYFKIAKSVVFEDSAKMNLNRLYGNSFLTVEKE